MRIDFECSGGYANLRLDYHANTDELPEDLRKELLTLVESSGFLDLEEDEVTPRKPGPPDVFSYLLSVSGGPRDKTLSFTDVTVPAELHPLLRRLRELAVSERTKGL